MQNAAESEEEQEEEEEEDGRREEPAPPPAKTSDVEDVGAAYKYTAEANRGTSSSSSSSRVKRALDNPNKKKSCSLYIQTDPLFWRHIRDQEGDDDKTEEEILSLIAQHVKAVNKIYSDTNFDGNLSLWTCF